jgi:hypothetical protein
MSARAAAPLPGRLVPAVLRGNRPPSTYLAGAGVSFVGDQVTMLALPLTAILALHAGAAQMGLLAAAGLAPNLPSPCRPTPWWTGWAGAGRSWSRPMPAGPPCWPRSRSPPWRGC